MSLPSALPEPDGFDPFLRDNHGAEIAQDVASIHRALLMIYEQEVLVGCPDGDLFIGRMVEPLAVLFSAEVEVVRGDRLAISDHRGIEFVGVHATVGAVIEVEGGRLARLFVPQEAIFYPGRQHVRIEGDLGADVTLETDDDLLSARGLDVSMGGIGVLVAASDGFLVGQSFLVHLTFNGTLVSLPARARSAEVEGDELRLGLQFAFHSDELERRIRKVLTKAIRSQPSV